MTVNRLSGSSETILERVERHDLPPTIEALAGAYEAEVGQRDRFLWKWIHALLPHVTLSTVPDEYAERAVDAKTAMSMLVVLLDDVGERDLDRATLNEASKVAFDGQTPDPDREGVDAETVAFAERTWGEVDALLEAPRREEFADVLEFDLAGTITAIEYSYLVNRNLEMATIEETWLYDSYNMMLLPYADIDLMFSPGFRRQDLGELRKVVRRAQQLARVGNWITTWEREVREGDFNSGVVVDALARGIVTTDELYALREGSGEVDAASVVDRIRGHDVEERFLDQWESDYEDARRFENRVDSVDVGAYLDGMERVMEFHLASRGLK